MKCGIPHYEFRYFELRFSIRKYVALKIPLLNENDRDENVTGKRLDWKTIVVFVTNCQLAFMRRA